LRDSKKEITLLKTGVAISTETLAYVATQARNYFTLSASSKDPEVNWDVPVPSHGLKPERTFGAVEALGIETF
jgi:hypothetical protein